MRVNVYQWLIKTLQYKQENHLQSPHSDKLSLYDAAGADLFLFCVFSSDSKLEVSSARFACFNATS